MFDLGPAAEQMSHLVRRLRDEDLTAPTPCPDYSLGDLLDHVNGLALAFTAAATKDPLPGGPQAPSGDASRLGAGWRDEIAARLDSLAAAWRVESAWSGDTYAGPVEMPAAQAAVVALDELVIHGWDIARASGQNYVVDPELLETCLEFVSAVATPGQGTPGLFGPPVDVSAESPLLDRTIGLTGRDPGWSPGSKE